MKPRKPGYHRHHLVPRHMGGSDDDDNIVYLTKQEHINAHLELYEKYGKDQDRRAALLIESGGNLDTPEFKQWRKENNARAALKAHESKLETGFYSKLGELNRQRISGSKNPEHSERMKRKFQENKMLWWNDGTKQMRSPDCPGDNWIRGRINNGNLKKTLKEKFQNHKMLWWNNGIENTRSPECPGENWVSGKIMKRNNQ